MNPSARFKIIFFIIPPALTFLLSACKPPGTVTTTKKNEPAEMPVNVSSYRVNFDNFQPPVPSPDVNPNSSHPLIPPKLTELEAKDISMNKNNPTVPGWRVQIYNGLSREDANQAKGEFLKKYDEPAYLTYVQPYYKIRVGDFVTKYDAKRLYHSLKSSYNSILIIQENVNLPELK